VTTRTRERHTKATAKTNKQKESTHNRLQKENRARRSWKTPNGANQESPQTASTPTNHESGEYPNAAQKRTDDPTRADNRENTASTDTGRPKAREAYEGRQTRRRPSEQDTETESAPERTTATTDTGADHRARGTEANNEEGAGTGATAKDTAPTTGRAETKEANDIANPKQRRQGSRQHQRHSAADREREVRPDQRAAAPTRDEGGSSNTERGIQQTLNPFSHTKKDRAIGKPTKRRPLIEKL